MGPQFQRAVTSWLPGSGGGEAAAAEREGAGQALRAKPRPAAPLPGCPVPGQQYFGPFFESSSAERIFCAARLSWSLERRQQLQPRH